MRRQRSKGARPRLSMVVGAILFPRASFGAAVMQYFVLPAPVPHQAEERDAEDNREPDPRRYLAAATTMAGTAALGSSPDEEVIFRPDPGELLPAPDEPSAYFEDPVADAAQDLSLLALLHTPACLVQPAPGAVDFAVPANARCLARRLAMQLPMPLAWPPSGDSSRRGVLQVWVVEQWLPTPAAATGARRTVCVGNADRSGVVSNVYVGSALWVLPDGTASVLVGHGVVGYDVDWCSPMAGARAHGFGDGEDAVARLVDLGITSKTIGQDCGWHRRETPSPAELAGAVTAQRSCAGLERRAILEDPPITATGSLLAAYHDGFWEGCCTAGKTAGRGTP